MGPIEEMGTVEEMAVVVMNMLGSVLVQHLQASQLGAEQRGRP